MFQIRSIFILLIIYTGLLNVCQAEVESSQADVELTIYVKPGTEECFYQIAKEGNQIELEYQVLDTASSPGINQEMDINAMLISPAGHILFSDYKKTDNLHRLTAKETGPYKLCFDNTFSRFAQKTVYFEMFVDDEESGPGWDDGLEVPTDPTDPKDDEYSNMLELLSRVHEALRKVRHFQDIKKAIEARHRNIQELNFSRVNGFSIMAIVVILGVGALQVVMLKSLFDSKSMIHQLLARLS